MPEHHNCILSSSVCPFAVLQVPLDATPAKIESAWRLRSRDCHPDKRPNDPTAKAKFQALTDAKETLLNPTQRAAAEAKVRTGARGRGYTTGGQNRKCSFRRASTRTNAGSTNNVSSKSGERKGQKRPQQEEQNVQTAERQAADIFFQHLSRKKQKLYPDLDAFIPPPSNKNRPKPKTYQKNGAAGSSAASVDQSKGLKHRAASCGSKSHVATSMTKFARTFRDDPQSKEDQQEDPSNSWASHPRHWHENISQPLQLPPAVSAEVLQAETGAPLMEARVLAKMVHKLRCLGGEAALTELANKTQKVHRLLAKYPRLFDIFVPASTLANSLPLAIHVRLRVIDSDWPSDDKQASAPHVVAANTSTIVTDGEESLSSPERRTRRRRKYRQELYSQGNFTNRSSKLEHTSPKLRTVVDVESESEGNRVGAHSVSSTESCDPVEDATSHVLQDAFGHANGTWSFESRQSTPSSSSPTQENRCFFLLSGAHAAALQSRKGMALFSFDCASKVLYEFLPHEDRCVVVWTPEHPATNAAIWTVLPLPPEEGPTQQCTA